MSGIYITNKMITSIFKSTAVRTQLKFLEIRNKRERLEINMPHAARKWLFLRRRVMEWSEREGEEDVGWPGGVQWKGS